MPRINFLFWNINRRPIGALAGSLALERKADVIVLAESEVPPASLLLQLNARLVSYHFLPGACEKLHFYSRFPPTLWRPVFERSRVSIRALLLPGCDELLVAAAHLPDGRSFKLDSQAEECERLAKDVERCEDQRGHTRTVLFGDLNASPFDPGLAGAYRLNATLNRQVALRSGRTVQGSKRRFFFNPMWGKYNDGDEGPSATYYYQEAGSITYYWHMFDQILVRPSLLGGFSARDVEVVSQFGDRSLLRRGRPDSVKASDHLPLVFSVELP